MKWWGDREEEREGLLLELCTEHYTIALNDADVWWGEVGKGKGGVGGC